MMKKSLVVAIMITLILTNFVLLPMDHVNGAFSTDFIQDTTQRSIAISGENLTFNISVSNNTFSEIWINYKIFHSNSSSGTWGNWTTYLNDTMEMNNSDGVYDNWTKEINIPSNASMIQYHYWANDGLDNWYRHPIFNENPNYLTIILSDVIQERTNRSAATTGENFTFNISLTKDIFSLVFINHTIFHSNYTVDGWSNWSINRNSSMLNESGNETHDFWTLEINIPSNATMIKYHFWANDSINDWIRYPVISESPNTTQ